MKMGIASPGIQNWAGPRAAPTPRPGSRQRPHPQEHEFRLPNAGRL